MKKKIYITGVSGSGKSALGAELKRQGCSVIDIDDDDFCAWCDKEGNLVTGSTRSGGNWLDDHFWNCNIERLEKEIKLSQNDKVFIVGISSNLDDYAFDQIFLLTLDSDALVERLTNRTTNDFAKDPAEQKHVLNNKERYAKMMLADGAIMLDASKSVTLLADEILAV